MKETLPNPGTHHALLNGAPVPYETENGAFCLALPVKLVGSSVEWNGKHTLTLIKSDGTPMNRSHDTLKQIFGWDGKLDSLFDLCESAEILEMPFEIVGEHKLLPPKQDDPESQEKWIFSTVFMNPVGGSAKMPEAADRKSMLAKYGAKFKALGGAAKPAASKPATAAAPAKSAAAPAKSAAPAAKPAVSGPPARKSTAAVPRTATQEEVWAAIVAANSELSEDAQAQAYYDAIEAVVEGGSADPASLTIQNWGQIMTNIGA